MAFFDGALGGLSESPGGRQDAEPNAPCVDGILRGQEPALLRQALLRIARARAAGESMGSVRN
jgi:hypothetical protein